jgi:NAD(P)-dependent dehydrogenase (short-subunit alcohol dehydrogenase family)
MLDIGNRVVMVSGASRGLGLAVAHTLYAAGYRLSLGVRDPKSAGLREVPWDPERVFVHRFDAMITAAPRAWVDATMDRFGGIDALINNAATAKHVGIELGPAASEDEQEAIFDELLTVNVKAPLRLIRAALPALRQCGHGRVVNVASLSGKRLPGLAVGYPMTKFALVALTHGLRRLGWEDGIRATVSMSRATEVGMPAEKMATPEELASIIELLLRLPNTSSIAELLVNNRFEDML